MKGFYLSPSSRCRVGTGFGTGYVRTETCLVPCNELPSRKRSCDTHGGRTGTNDVYSHQVQVRVVQNDPPRYNRGHLFLFFSWGCLPSTDVYFGRTSGVFVTKDSQTTVLSVERDYPCHEYVISMIILKSRSVYPRGRS